MVAVISGNGLGLLGTSAASLGMAAGGQAGLDQSGASQYVNVATGNLIVTDQDERLVAQGLMAGLVRTYNSLGSNGDLGAGSWLLGLDRRLGDLTGTLNASGSSLTRDGGDGETQVFAYDSTRGLYVASEKDGASDTLQWNATDSSWSYTAGGSLREETYDASGTLKALRDGKTGASYTLGYNAGQQLESVTAGDGEALLLQYDAAGRVSGLSTLEVPAGGGTAQTVSRVSYHYDTLGRLDVVSTDLTPDDGTDANTFTTTYGYDGTSQRLASMSQSDGIAVSYTYAQDGQGTYRIASVTLGSGGDAKTQSFAYDLAARTTTVTDAGGRAWTYGYDAQGNLSSVTSPAVNGQREITRYSYTADGHLGSVTDAMGRATTYEYDVHGNRTLERDPLGNTVTYTYSSSDQLLTRTVYRVPDPDGVGAAQPTDASTTRYVYDISNRLRYVIDADGDVQETQYNGQGLVQLTRGYAGANFDTSALAVDAVPGLVSMDSWSAAQDLVQTTRTDYAYDAAGRLTGKTQWAVVDSAGEGMLSPTMSISQFTYDAQGLLRQQVTRANSPTADTVSYSYDGLGRLLGRTDTLGTTAYAYLDGQGVVAVTQQSTGLVRTETRNSAGELTAVTTSASGETSRRTQYVYDADGQLRAAQDAGGAVSYRFYDAAGRLAGTVDATGAVTRYQRDADGRTVATTQYATRIDTTAWFGAGDASGIPVDLDGVLPVADAHDRTSLSLYDASGRLAAEVDADGYATTYVYDGAGNLTASTAHAVALTADQRLALQASPETTVLAPNADDRTSYTFHDLANRVVGTLDASGYVTTTAYDAAGRVTKTVAYATGLEADQRVALGNAPTLAGVLNHLSGDPANPDDQVTRSYYDAEGEVVAQIDAGGYLTTLFHNERTHTRGSTRYAKALNATQLASLTGHENKTTLVGYLSGSSSQTQYRHYRPDGHLQSETAADGTATVYDYNDAGQLTGTVTTPPSGGQVRTTEVSHDAFGDVLTSTDGAGATTTYTYNVRGQRVLTTDALGNQTWNVYDPSSGRLVYTVTGIASDGTANALGEVTHFQYDSFGEVVQTTRLAARLDLVALGMDTDTSVVALEAAVATIADPAHDASTTTDYTHRGQVAERRDALGYATTVSYDAFGDTVRTRHQVTQPGQALSTGNSVITTYRYDARGQQTDRTDDAGALNRSTRTQYDAFGRITAQLDGRGNAVSYTYDRLGRQITASQVVQGGPRTTQSTYDAYGRVLTRTDAMGQVTTYGYSPDTHTLTVTTPDAVVVTRITDAYGDTLSVTDGAGNTTSYRYDGDGRLVDTIDALGQTRHHDYNAVGQLTGSTDASGRVVGYTYDALGRTLTRTVDPDGLAQTTRYAYDGRGQQVSVTDANGIVSSYAYDADGQLLTQVEDAGTGAEHLNLTTTYTWNGAGEQLSVTEGAGTAEARTTQYVYDSLGRRTQQIIDPAGLALTTDYVYDGNDNLVAVTDPKRQTTRYVYDQANQQVYTIDPAGAVVQSFYDADGRVTATRRYATAIDTTGLGTSPGLDQIAVNASSADQRRYTVYDAAGRVHYTVDPLGFISEQRYDAAGRLAETIAYAKAVSNQAFNNAHLFEAMVAGTADADMAALIGAAGNTEANAHASVNLYDEDGRVRFVVQQNTVDGQRTGVVHERRYDAAGRVTDQLAYGTALSLSAGSLAGQLSTSSVAQILAGTAAHQTRYVHDGAGQVRYTIDAGGYVSEQQYDGNGRVVQALTYLNAITVPASLSETSVAGAISARNTAASTRATTTAYDHAGRVHTTGDALGINATYRYDATGLKTAFTNRDGHTWTYSYDAAGRLRTETSPAVTVGTFGGTASVSTTSAGLVTRYTYDANGNVLSRTEADGTSDARTIAYRYDSRGHQIQTIYPDAGYVDPATGVYHATGAGTTTATVTYDALGHAVVNRDVGGHYQYKLYDSRGALSYAVDGNGYVSAYRYDAEGNTICVTRYAHALKTPTTEWSAGEPLSAAQLAAGLTLDSAQDRTLTTVYDQRNQKVQVTQDAIGYTLAKGINARQSGTGTPTTRYTYDAYGNLTRTAVKVQEASGTPGTASYDEAWWASTYHYYDALGHKVMDVDPMGYVSTWAYDGSGQVTTAIEYANAIATGSLGTETRPGLPALGGPTHGYDRSTVITYDAIGRKASIILNGHFGWVNGASGLAAGSSVTQLRYDGEDHVTELTVNGATTHTTYDALGRVAKVSEPTRAVLAANWQVQLQNDPALDLSQFQSSLYIQVSPLTTITYDALGNAVRTTRSATGAATQSTYTHYDTLGRQVIAVDAKGTSFYSGYDATGNVTASWYTLTGNDGAATVTTRCVYDATGQRLSTTVSRAGTIESAQLVKYNAFGEITAKGDGVVGPYSTDGYEATYSYNRAGQLVSGSDAQHGVQHRYSYSLTGAQLSDTWDLDGSGHTASLAWHLDLDDRRVSQFQPSTTASTGEAAAPVHTSYDRWGNVLSTTDARGYVTSYSYDSQNHLYAEVEPQALVVGTNGSRAWQAPTKHWYYDINGRLAGTRDENGHTTQNTFDAAGNLVCSQDGVGALSYIGHDALGRAVARQTPPVTTTTGPVVHITWSRYDDNNQVTAQGDFRRTVDGSGRTQATQQSYLLNTTGDRIRITDALGHSAYYEFDSQHHVVKSQSALQRAANVAETFGYDVNGNKVSDMTPNVDSTGAYDQQSWVYDYFGRVRSHVDLSGAVTQYSYDAFTGLLSQQTSNWQAVRSQMTNPGYLPYNQITGDTKISYEYFADGQIKQVTDHVADAITGWTAYQYDEAGETIDADTTTTDGAGQQVHIDTHTDYDSHGRLAVVTQFDPDTGKGMMRTAYNYDAAGNRRAVFVRSGFGPNAAAFDTDGGLPTVGTIADQVAQPGEVFSLDASAAFSDPLGMGLTWYAKQADGSNLPAWLHYGSTGVFGGTPTAAGSWVIRMTATDVEGHSVDTTFALTVPTVAPVFSGGMATQTAHVGTALNFTAPAATDANSAAITYTAGYNNGSGSWLALPAWLSFDATTRSFSGTPPVGSIASYALRVVAHADNGTATALGFTLTVASTPPVYTGGVASQVADDGRAFSYTIPSGSFVEHDGTTLSYAAGSYAMVNGVEQDSELPSWLSFDAGSYTFHGTPPAELIGQSFSLFVRATNPQGQSAQAHFSVGVQAYRQPDPLYHGGYTDQTGVIGGTAITIAMPAGAFTEPDGGALSYSAQVLIPAHTRTQYDANHDVVDVDIAAQWVALGQVGLAINATSGAITGVPTTLDYSLSAFMPNDIQRDSNYAIQVVASNAQNGTAQTQFTLRNVFAPPAVVSPLTNQTVNPKQGSLLVVQSDTFSDPEGLGLIYSAALTSGAGLPAGLIWSGTSVTIGTLASGAYGIRITATDQQGQAASSSFTLNVNNAAPVFSSSPASRTVIRDFAMASYQAPAATDANGDAVSYSASGMPPGITFNTSTRTFAGTATQTGTYTVTYKATDGHGLSSSASFTITVNVATLPPVYSGSYLNQTGVIGGSSLSIPVPAGAFTSPGGQAVSYSAQVLIPAHTRTQYDANHNVVEVAVAEQWVSISQVGLSIDAGSGTISGVPTTLDYSLSAFQPNDMRRDASYQLRVIGSNPYGSVASAAFTLTNSFAPPSVASPLANHTVNPGQGAVTIIPAATFNDPYGQGLTYSATLTSGATLPSGLGWSGSSIVVSAAAAGSYGIKVIARDALGRTASASFTLTVNNAAPVLATPANKVGYTNVALTPFQGTAATDANGDSISYSATGLPAGVVFNASTRTFSGAPTTAGTYTITYNATDSHGAVTARTFTLTVNVATVPPVYHGGYSNQTGVIGGSPITIGMPSGAFTSPGGQAITYSAQVLIPAHTRTQYDGNHNVVDVTVAAQWVSVSQVGLAINATSGAISGVPTTLDYSLSAFQPNDMQRDASYKLEVIASNAYGATSAQFTLSNSFAPPAVTAALANHTVSPGQGSIAIVLSNTFSDPYGQGLSYSATLTTGAALPSGLGWSGSSVVVGKIASGSYAIKVTARDGLGRTTASSFTLTVSNAAPVLGNLVNQTATRGGAMVAYQAPAATDANGDAITYSASGMPASVVFSAATRTFSGNPSTAGTFTISYKATDSKGASTTRTFTLTVNVQTTKPVYYGGYGTSYSGTIGSAFSLAMPSGAFVSPGGQAITYSAQVLIPAHTRTQYDANHNVVDVTVAAQWVSVSQVGLAINATSGAISGVPTTLDYSLSAFQPNDMQRDASYKLEVIASNAYGATSAQFTLSNSYKPPALLKALPDLTVNPKQGAVTTVPAGSFSDPIGNGLTYTTSGLPGGVTSNGSALVIGTTAAGSHTITITARDSQGRTVSDSLVLTVRNAAPVLGALSNRSATQNATMVSFAMPAASDANGDAISYSASGMPAGVVFSAATRTFSGKPTAAGNFTITYKATDSHGAATSKTFVLSVAAAVVAGPVYNGGIPSTVTLANNGDVYTIPSGAFVSPSGLPLTYSATGYTASWLLFDASAHTITRGYTRYGGYDSVHLTVTDSLGHSVTVTFNVEATAPIDGGGGRFGGGTLLMAADTGTSIDPTTGPVPDDASTVAASPGQSAGHSQAAEHANEHSRIVSGTPADDGVPDPVATGDTTSGVTAPHASLMQLPDPTDPGTGGTPTPTPNLQAYWFTYDADNRVQISNGALSGGQIVLTREATSYELNYDAAGDQVARTTLNADGHTLVQYSYYDQRNQLERADYSIDTTLSSASRGIEELRRYDNAGHLTATAKFYELGHQLHANGGVIKLNPDSIDPVGEGAQVGGMLASATIAHYDADGRLAQSQNFGHNGPWDGTGATDTVPGTLPGIDATSWAGMQLQNQVSYRDSTGASGYDASGNVLHYQYRDIVSDRTDTYNVFYKKKDSYLESVTNGTSTSADYTVAADFSYYNVFGQRLAISQRFEPPGGTLHQDVRAFAYDANGQILQRRDGTEAADHTFSATGGAGTTHYAYVNGQQVGSVDEGGGVHVLDGLTAFSNAQSGSSGYVIQQGDTLKSIAQAQYGNASLWYVVAQANGLASDDDLAAGQSLSIPQVTTNSNDASTFKPYSPAEIAGSTTPPAVYIPKPPAQQCDALAVIFVLAVEIVVTAYAGPIAGNAAGQLAGDAMGTHKGFSVKELAIAAAASYVGAEVGEGLQGSSAFTENAGANGLNVYGNAVVGASSYVAGYETAELLGEPAHFSVAGLIAAGAGSAAAGQIGPTQAQVQTGQQGGTFWTRVGANVVQDVVTRETSILLGDHHVQSWQDILQDVFRNAAVDAIRTSRLEQGQERLNQAEKRLLAKQEARVGADIDLQADSLMAERALAEGNARTQAQLQFQIDSDTSLAVGADLAALRTQAGAALEAEIDAGFQKDFQAAVDANLASRVAEDTAIAAAIADWQPRQSPSWQLGLDAYQTSVSPARTSTPAPRSSWYVPPDSISTTYDDATNAVFDSREGLGTNILAAAVTIVGAPVAVLDKTLNWIENVPYFSQVVSQDFASAYENKSEGDALLYSLKGIHDFATLTFGALSVALPFEKAAPLEVPGTVAAHTTASSLIPLEDVAPSLELAVADELSTLREAGVPISRTPLSYDISNWGASGLPSDGYFVRSLTQEQYVAMKNGLDVNFGGQPMGAYSPLDENLQSLGYVDPGHPNGMGFIGSAEQLTGITTRAGYMDAMKLDYAPKYLVEFQLNDPVGLYNTLHAPYPLFKQGGLTRGTTFTEFNYPQLNSQNIVNARFRELR